MGLDRPIGALVESVTDGGPAAKAGLKPGDIITAVDGRDASDPQAVLTASPPRALAAMPR